MSEQKTLPFTKYTLPNGRKTPIQVPVSDQTYARGVDLIMRGYVFEIEQLRTGHVSATIGDPVEEVDLAFALCPPSSTPEQIAERIEGMINEFVIGK